MKMMMTMMKTNLSVNMKMIMLGRESRMKIVLTGKQSHLTKNTKDTRNFIN